MFLNGGNWGGGLSSPKHASGSHELAILSLDRVKPERRFVPREIDLLPLKQLAVSFYGLEE